MSHCTPSSQVMVLDAPAVKLQCAPFSHVRLASEVAVTVQVVPSKQEALALACRFQSQLAELWHAAVAALPSVRLQLEASTQLAVL